MRIPKGVPPQEWPFDISVSGEERDRVKFAFHQELAETGQKVA